MKVIRYGIIGLGGIGSRFARVLKTAPGVELTAVAARDGVRASQFAEQYGARTHYGKYRDLAEDPEVDAVYIALTHNFHYEIAKLCLENGKHVICEKPFFLHGNEARELAELARSKGLTLMEAMWTRCLPAFQKAREWVRDGRIGEPRLVQAAFCFRTDYNPEHRLFDPALAGGAIYDVGVYVTEFATGILDENPVEVQAVCHRCGTGVDDYTALSLRFESGALASLSCGMTGASSTDAHVVGGEGRIVVHEFFQTKKVELFDRNQKLVETFEDSFEDGFLYQINHFSDLVRNGTLESPLIPLRDTIACADLFDRVRILCDLP